MYVAAEDLSTTALDINPARAVAYEGSSVSVACHAVHKPHPRVGAPCRRRRVHSDFGKTGRVYREAAEADATLESIIDDLLTGQFNNPVRVIASNTSEGWSRDVSEDVAREVLRLLAGRRLAASSRKFVETYVDEDELLRSESGLA